MVSSWKGYYRSLQSDGSFENRLSGILNGGQRVFYLFN
jgi:hypothetical protein